MLATDGKRKRARRACIPCHQRKRKCDAGYPCGMCTTYEYTCRYADESSSGIGDGSAVRVSEANKRRNSRKVKHTRRSLRHASATTGTPAVTPGGIFDEQKSRYAGVSAAMAFPHVLGVALGSEMPPNKIKSFAYNFGIRPEEASTTHGSLAKLISEEDLGAFSGVFFSALAPIMDILDPKIYAQRCREYYHSRETRHAAFGAIAAGVAALGSFLSRSRHPRESELVKHAKDILDDPATMRMLRIDHILALGLRVLYLRATTRPNNAWIASCTAMHLCEAVGLHEEENILKIASVPGAALIGHDADRLRRLFWISWAGHSMLSYESDRSSVQFRAVTCQAITPTPGSVADQFVQIALIIPSQNSPFVLEGPPQTLREELFGRLKALGDLEFMHPFLVLTKADLAFCFYRRIYQLKMGISDDMIKLVVDMGNAAVEAALQLANQGRLFWHVIGSVFQFACTLLAIDSPTASTHIAGVFMALEDLVRVADTAITREALSTARNLLNLSIAKKRNDLTQLEAVETNCQSFNTSPETMSNGVTPDANWGLDWDQFLMEPFLSMLGPEFQL